MDQRQLEIIRGTRKKQGGFMMGVWKRLRDISAATVNDLLDKTEDPVKMLDQYLRDMEQDITDAEAAVAKQIAVEKRCKIEFDEACAMSEKREEQALKALEAGNEDWQGVPFKTKKNMRAELII